MKTARAAAIVTWVYAAAWGLPVPYVAGRLILKQSLPQFMGMFTMFEGPWSRRHDDRTFLVLLGTFMIVSLVTAWSGWLIWRGRRSGAVLNLVLLPVEAVFWVGFALPFPWLCGGARFVLLVAAWPSLRPSRP